MRKTILTLICLTFICMSLFAIDIVDTDKKTLAITTDIITECFFNIHDTYWTFPVPAVDIEFSGKRKGKAGFEFSLDLEEIFNEDYNEILNTAYLWVDLPKRLKLTVGQFKAPFGQEISLGKQSRPYPFHSISSDIIAPGLDRGIMISGNNYVKDIIDFDAGIFNGSGTELKNINYNSILITGKINLSFNIKDKVKIRTGYSALYNWEHDIIHEHTFSHGLFGSVQIKPISYYKITYFAEYMERHYTNETVNADAHWTYGLFNYLALKVKKFEVFTTFEFYREDAEYQSLEDEWMLSSGLNFYLFKYLKFTLMYEGENWFNQDVYEHQITALAHIKF